MILTTIKNCKTPNRTCGEVRNLGEKIKSGLRLWGANCVMSNED